MRPKELVSVIAIAFTTQVLMLSKAAESKIELYKVLEDSGGNRTELETAVHDVKGKDTEYLIIHASQYDLVNLTAEQIIENITYARKVRDEAVPYLGERLDEEMWREWVLPHRVLEEDLCLWRKDFYDKMQPVIAGKTTTAEVAEAIRYWLWGNGGVGQKRVKFGPAENRQRTPVQALNGGTAACGELAALHVSFLRSVGIPARHCSSGFEQGKDNWHFYTEYWNSQLKCWVAMDDLPLPLAKKVQLGTCRSLVAQAAPGFNSFANAYFTEDYSQLVEVTENLCERELLILKVPSGKNGDGKGAVAVWNSKTWRTVGMANPEVNGTSYQIALSKLKGNELPVLFTIVRDRKLMWSLKNPNGQDGVVDLQAAQPGVCLRWPPANREDDSHGGLQSDP